MNYIIYTVDELRRKFKDTSLVWNNFISDSMAKEKVIFFNDTIYSYIHEDEGNNREFAINQGVTLSFSGKKARPSSNAALDLKGNQKSKSSKNKLSSEVELEQAMTSQRSKALNRYIHSNFNSIH